MDIDHITFAATGGAGLVAKTLAETQSNMGHDSKLITSIRGGLREHPFEHPALTMSAVIDQHIVRSTGSSAMFSMARRQLSTIDLGKVRKGALIHLHWVEGVVDHENVKNWLGSGRKLVWSLHDMSPFTGGCHSNLGCRGFESSCSNCPQVKQFFQKRIQRNFESTNQFDSSISRLRLVAPTKWMARMARQSSIFRNTDVTVICNPISVDFFRKPDRLYSRHALGLNSKEIVAVAVAAQLDNPLKRIAQIVEIFFSATKQMGLESKFILVGSNGAQIAQKNRGCLWLGPMSSSELARVIPAADFLISGSESESAGMTILEAAALQVPSVVVKNGGSNELIIDGENGFLLEQIGDLFGKIQQIASSQEKLEKMGQSASIWARANAHPNSSSKKFLSLYESIA